jgi:hypothetical protein
VNLNIEIKEEYFILCYDKGNYKKSKKDFKVRNKFENKWHIITFDFFFIL